ncbi:unnamed protein product [Vitrella brassicaformis CCMP3155]|uniref:Uncharacterized protein n=1 Tax=Vitrella brassicaformis (strain CCMP3155) TaxID=1169540 RepID=A0A0G4G944_VITBC|nr:unnamed protein product [Vitrella brassicaformis CCMP3155]|eukprot:CEM25093.1 unnamed protein product [Vitrella brassicaformis CCMP3155]
MTRGGRRPFTPSARCSSHGSLPSHAVDSVFADPWAAEYARHPNIPRPTYRPGVRSTRKRQREEEEDQPREPEDRQENAADVEELDFGEEKDEDDSMIPIDTSYLPVDVEKPAAAAAASESAPSHPRSGRPSFLSMLPPPSSANRDQGTADGDGEEDGGAAEG